jgi:hypothetical protein
MKERQTKNPTHIIGWPSGLGNPSLEKYDAYHGYNRIKVFLLVSVFIWRW